MRLTELEERSPPQTATQLLHKKLEMMDLEFKTHHLMVIYVVADDEAAATEQLELNSHDNYLQVRLKMLLAIPAASTPTLTSDVWTIAERRLDQFDARLSLANTAVSRLTCTPMYLHMVDLYQKELAELKKELSEIRNDVLTIITDGSDTLIVKCLLYDPDSHTKTLTLWVPTQSVKHVVWNFLKSTLPHLVENSSTGNIFGAICHTLP